MNAKIADAMGEIGGPSRPADTIVAPATGAGLAAIAVIRISGPKTRDVLTALCGAVPPARRASLRDIGPARSGPIDRGLVVWFPGPASFTGEDMAELQVHGSRAVVREIIEAVLTLAGTRLAEPGEFVARAFANGKLDLLQVEGLADLINAETRCQREQALAQSEGIASSRYEDWRKQLLKAQALVEADLDFADEGDVDVGTASKAEIIVGALLAQFDEALRGFGQRLRDGVRVVIAGPPNAGKSSLMNALAKRDVAIVSEEAGTTRDVIEVHLDLAGLSVILTDTAGLREARGGVEAEGIRRALSRAEDADLIVWVVDATTPVWDPPAELRSKTRLSVLNKIDLAGAATRAGEAHLPVSARTGEGLDQLIAALQQEAVTSTEAGAGSPVMTRARHRVELEGARAALQRFVNHVIPELRAEELRIAARHLGRITGRIDVEEVLGQIFAEFCIGK